MPILLALRVAGAWLGPRLNWLLAHPAVLAFGLALIFGAYERHEAQKAQRVAHSAIVALDTTKASLVRTEQALADQNAAIKRMAGEATARQNAAQKALGAATERAKGLEAAAGRIDAANAHRASGGPCVTDRAVLDARGEL